MTTHPENARTPVEPGQGHDPSSAPSSPRFYKSPGLYGLLLVLIILGGLGFFFGHNFPRMRLFVESLGPWAPLAFLAIYLVLAPCFFPLSILDLSCGAMFGVTRGFEILTVASGLAALEMYVGSRWLFAKRVGRFIEARPKLHRFYALAGLKDWKILALLRLSPTNFAVVNYVLGAARVSFTRYMVTWLILVPKALLHASIGHALYRLGETAPTTGAVAKSETLVLVLGLVSILLLVAILSRRMRRALEKIADRRKISS